MKTALVFILLSLTCASCKSGNEYGADSNYDTKEYQNSLYSDSDYSDPGITWRVKQVLSKDKSLPASSRLIHVSTNDGIVTLSGTVPSSSEKSAIIRKVKSIRGVRSVNDQISVQNQ